MGLHEDLDGVGDAPSPISLHDRLKVAIAAIRDYLAPDGDGNSILDIQGEAEMVGLKIRGAESVTVHSLLEIIDYLGAPIMWVSNAGGLAVTDELYTTKSTDGPNGFHADIYGFARLGQVAMFGHAGPPGNRLTYETACAEVFNGTRAASVGNWVNGSSGAVVAAIADPFAAYTSPGKGANVRRWTQTTGTSFIARTGFTAVTPGQYVNFFTWMKANSSSGTFTPTLRYNLAGVYQAAKDMVGTPIAVTSAGWVLVGHKGVVPAAVDAVELGITGTITNGLIFYESGSGLWVDTRTSSSADPNPELIYSPPLLPWPAFGTWTGSKRGDIYFRSDATATVAKRMYMLDAANDDVQLTAAIGAPGSTAQPRWVPIGS